MKRYVGPPQRSAHRVRQDIDEELAYHLRRREEDLVAQGIPRALAQERAQREFGDVEDAKAYLTRIDLLTESAKGRQSMLSDFVSDIKHGARALLRARLFAITAVWTLALGIGASTAVYSVVHGVLLRPLPYPAPQELFRVWSSNPTAGIVEGSISPVDIDDWRAGRKRIKDLGAYWFSAQGSGLDLTSDAEPERLAATFVTPGFFTTLAVNPVLGRLPREEELVRGGPDRVVVLSNAFWRRRFNADTAMIGRTLTMNGRPYLVIGVMPESFTYPSTASEVFVPYSTITDDMIPRLREVRVLAAIARAPGLSADEVRAELSGIAAQLSQTYPENKTWNAASALPLRDAVTRNVQGALWVLLAAVSCLLLIGCVNIASLLLARAISRSREIAVRTALGAGRGRLLRQLVTESSLIALLGGALGVAVGAVGLKLLLALSAGQLPRAESIRIDTFVLLFALGLTALVSAVCGVVPALRLTDTNVQSVLRSGGRGVIGGPGVSLRSALVVVEVALAMVLVVGGGLMVNSYVRLTKVNPGFDPSNRAVLTMSLSGNRGDYLQTLDNVLDRVRAVPGVIAAGSIRSLPLRGSGEDASFSLPGATRRAGEVLPSAAVLHVSTDIFKALGTRLLEGREFATSDREDAPRVLVVNQAFARKWFPGKSAVGQEVLLWGENRASIVGVAEDIRQSEVAEPAEPTFYFHVRQNGRVGVNLIVHTVGNPLTVLQSLRNAVWEVDKLLPIAQVTTLEATLADGLARPRMYTVLLAAFGVVGMLLGALGLYGVLSYLVGLRQREIGVRIAVGATRESVLRLFVRYGLTLTGVGIAIGLFGAYALGKAMASVLYDVRATDPVTIGAVSALLLLTGILASWVPALRAARVDPIITLRQD